MKDYYAILGISPKATTEEVRAAFREQAKRLHPDYYRGDSQPFREAQEAWAVLGDPDARRSYDDRRPRPRAQPVTAATHPPEPLTARHPPRPTDYIGSRPPAAGQPGVLVEVEVRLSAAAAAAGAVVALPVRLRETCPRCGGWSRRLGRECGMCVGHGWVSVSVLWRVRLPGGVRDGQSFDLAMGDDNGRPRFVRLHLAVSG